MANICTTTYIVTADREQIEQLHKALKETKKAYEKKKGYVNPTLKDLLKKFKVKGSDAEWIISFSDIQEGKEKDVPYVEICVESRWSRDEDTPNQIWEALPGCSVWFMSEELGCGIFVTNDENGIYFPETVILDNEDEGMEYMTKEEAHRKICRILHKGMKKYTIEELLPYLNRRNSRICEGKISGPQVFYYEAEIAA